MSNRENMFEDFNGQGRCVQCVRATAHTEVLEEVGLWLALPLPVVVRDVHTLGAGDSLRTKCPAGTHPGVCEGKKRGPKN